MKSVVYAIEVVFAKHPEFREFNNIWYFPSVDEYKKLLEDSGFKVEYIELIPRPTPMKSLAKWLDIFANGICKNLRTTQFDTLKQEVEEICKDRLFDKSKNIWKLDYVRLRVKALKL